MASFMSNLWDGVFTPGPTPTLLVASNAAFAALQAVLAALLVATRSVHFAILSVLCAGLWWSINWFAGELAAAQAKEEEAARLRRKRRDGGEKSGGGGGGGGGGAAGGGEDSADDEGEETEVEGEGQGQGASVSSLDAGEGEKSRGAEVREGVAQALGAGGPTDADHTQGIGKTTGLQPPGGADGKAHARQRPASADLSSASEMSTDSEWEKVSSSGDK